MSKTIVFSDLDGTLLDHKTYAFAPAQPALDMLKQRGIPLVLATSKTAAEVAALRAEIGVDCYPAIVENGAGVLPAFAEAADGSEHDRLLTVLDGLPKRLRAGFRGFSDWGPAGISARTGLGIDAARKAAARQFSEPGLWVGPREDEPVFIAALGRHGVAARHGGRFLTLSFGATKASRMAEIGAKLAPGARTIALGDAPNDAEMIAAADIGVIVANPVARPMDERLRRVRGRVLRTELPGPAGWNQAVLALIEELETDPRPREQ